ncbi:MAG: ribosomal protein S18 acetylase RimI-like enzyme [Myxococcota bacterium]|jgi:ribosomal protein S18 acetylase RimI-like enzyme
MRWDHLDGLRIESARVRDALPVLGLHRDILAEREWFITLPDEFAAGLDAVGSRIGLYDASDNSLFLVARLPGVQVAGFLVVHGGHLSRMRHTGKLEVMVARAHRGRGVGRALLAACLEWARASPVLEKLGLSVFASNVRALALYQEHGFVEEGRRPREYRMTDGTYRDDVLMYTLV